MAFALTRLMHPAARPLHTHACVPLKESDMHQMGREKKSEISKHLHLSTCLLHFLSHLIRRNFHCYVSASPGFSLPAYPMSHMSTTRAYARHVTSKFILCIYIWTTKPHSVWPYKVADLIPKCKTAARENE